MLEPMAVAVHAMRRAMPDRAHTVAVCGLGTIGLLLAMFLREAGVGRVLAIGNKDLQRREAVGMGLPEDCFFDSRGGPAFRWVMERTKGLGADVFFECVGRDETVAEAVQGTAPGGQGLSGGEPGLGHEAGKGCVLEDPAQPADGDGDMEFRLWRLDRGRHGRGG